MGHEGEGALEHRTPAAIVRGVKEQDGRWRPRSPAGTASGWYGRRVLKAAVIVLVLLILLLGLPLGMPMSGTSMCPDCSNLGAWGLMCIVLLGSIVLLMQGRAAGILADRARRPLLVPADALERPPRSS